MESTMGATEVRASVVVMFRLLTIEMSVLAIAASRDGNEWSILYSIARLADLLGSQLCAPYRSATAAATNFLRPAPPGLVSWVLHQSK